MVRAKLYLIAILSAGGTAATPAFRSKMSRRVASALKRAAPDLMESRDERSRSIIEMFTLGDLFLMFSTVETAVDRVRAVMYICAGL